MQYEQVQKKTAKKIQIQIHSFILRHSLSKYTQSKDVRHHKMNTSDKSCDLGYAQI